MQQKHRQILVTNALPYANGHLHLGHLVGYIQGDIWVRFQRMRGHECYFVCGSDQHGTPIMIKAQQLGIEPEVMVEQIHQEHAQDLADFHVTFDNFYKTHCPENEKIATDIFKRLQDKGQIQTKTIQQAFDPEKNMFLPDRYVQGTCPKCEAVDQYGDNCEVCGATYSPSELKDAVSVLTGAKPIEKESLHYFFTLSQHEELLKQWATADHLQPAVVSKLQEWFEQGFRDWDISRDAPYFGFNIPGESDKYLYVWLDAPMGYMASFEQYCKDHPKVNFDDYWGADSKTELHHFIGKDIIYFHTLFWPAVLHNAGYRMPTSVVANGFLTVDGQKMSKSRGTFIKARTYLDQLGPEYLRYYFAAKLNSGIDDLDLNLDDFVARVNSDLVGKFINIASRCAGFISKRFDGQLSDSLHDQALFDSFANASDVIAEDYEKREFSRAIRRIMELADHANQYINDQAPWVLVKEAGKEALTQQVCTMGINLFRVLMVYLKPILPALAEKVEGFLAIEPLQWHDAQQPLLNHSIQPFKHLMQRIDDKRITAMKEAAQQDLDSKVTAVAEDNNCIEIDDFMKVDLRIAKIVLAESVEGADKLIKLTLDIGEEKHRTVFAGIKSAYSPEDLTGRMTIMVANLKPRKMRFGLSEGMVLAAGPGGDELYILSPDSGAKPGMRAK